MTPRISAIAYHVTALPGWAAQEAKLAPLLADCDLALLPEYAGMEAALMAHPPGTDPLTWRDRAADQAEVWEAQLAHLAQVHKCWITGATIPARTDRGIVNRGYLVAPWGEVHHQDKLILTPYERETLQMVPGDGLTLIDTVWGRFGMLICYDSEFPFWARALAEAGADLILVPSCTDTAHGQSRVRLSCLARALETQSLVVQAPLVGDVPSCEIIDTSTGQSGAFVPPDTGLPASGILAEAAPDAPGALRLAPNFATLQGARQSGQTRNFQHWPEQFDRDIPVRVVAS